ncbi:MAG: DUF4397 domain-containing protein [Actinomycetes bacterium]
MKKLLAALVAATALLVAAPAVAGAQTGTSQVYVTHGLPLDDAGTKVDVYVNGGLAIDDFTFGRTVGPLTLPAASYDVEIRTPDGATTLIGKTVAVPAGGNFSLVASFVDSSGTPGINVFRNDVRRVPSGFGRLGLHHAAAAPAVDVYTGLFPVTRWFPHLRSKAVAGAPNGAEADLVLPSALRYTVDVNVAGTATRVLKLDNVKVPARTLTNVYVVGSASGGTLQVISSAIAL